LFLVNGLIGLENQTSGSDELSISALFETIEQVLVRQDAEFERYPLCNIAGLLRISREERWTSVCYEVRWIVGFGKESDYERRTRVISSQDRGLLAARTLFIRQMICKEQSGLDITPFPESKPIFTWGWSVMQRDLSTSGAEESVGQFEDWLKTNYPGIRIPVEELAKTNGIDSVHMLSNIVLLLVPFALLSPLTLFHYDPERKASAVLFCVWLVAFPILRWARLGHRAEIHAYLSGRKLCWRGFTTSLFFVTSYFVIQGFLVTCVGLFESFCGLPSDQVPWTTVTVIFWYTSSVIFVLVLFLFPIIRKSTFLTSVDYPQRGNRAWVLRDRSSREQGNRRHDAKTFLSNHS